jgi:hypothetical protein
MCLEGVTTADQRMCRERWVELILLLCPNILFGSYRDPCEVLR